MLIAAVLAITVPMPKAPESSAALTASVIAGVITAGIGGISFRCGATVVHRRVSAVIVATVAVAAGLCRAVRFLVPGRLLRRVGCCFALL